MAFSVIVDEPFLHWERLTEGPPVAAAYLVILSGVYPEPPSPRV